TASATQLSAKIQRLEIRSRDRAKYTMYHKFLRVKRMYLFHPLNEYFLAKNKEKHTTLNLILPCPQLL
ncbi:MAG: hypothetical protein QM500_04275, partial [Methylococcales bacterium]